MESDDFPLVQLASAQLCGHSACWKVASAVTSPHVHFNGEAGPLKVSKENPIGLQNEFVYESRQLLSLMRCSQNGRYMYINESERNLMVVDLHRNVYTLFKPVEDWGSEERIRDLLVVNPTTILVSTSNGEYISRLHVCRLRVDESAYDHLLLFTHDGNCWQRFVSFALVQISGREVDVKRAVLGDECALVFLRVDVDEPRATVDHDPYLHHFMNGAFFASHWSADGREVNAICHHDSTVLFVYSMERKQWSEEKLTGSEQRLFDHSCGNSTTIYANTPRKPQDGPARMFCCNLDRKRWEEVPFAAEDVRRIFSIVNSEDGKDDGLVVVKSEEFIATEDESRVHRYKIARFKFRNPDSLRIACLVAARKSREEIAGEEGFQQKMNEPPYKSVLPSLYPNMTPIPVRRF